MSVWSTAFINNLPDSSFAFIEAGGKKDSDGKTAPRDLRHLPYKDADGDTDVPHTRNALARLDQTQGIPAAEKAAVRAKLQNALSKASNNSLNGDHFALSATAISLDANGQLPTRFPLFVTGDWPNSVKGDFSVSLDDLRQMKDNFERGVGFPTEDASTGLAIDFKHDYDDQAAGWIKGLELQADPNDPERGTLYANPVEWTDAGAQAIQAGRFKCVSPMGAFGRKNGELSLWQNATNLKEKIANVIEGAGLTNIPFLRGMAPIRADKLDEPDTAYANVIDVERHQHKKEPGMNIDSLRIKERDELSVPELDYLAENKDKLSAAELERFKLEAAKQNEQEQLSAEDRELLDAIHQGSKVVSDKESQTAEQQKLAELEKTALDYRTEKAEQVVDSHIGRGAIKTESRDFWTGQLLSADGDSRKALEDQLSALPSNADIAKEIGTKEETVAGSTAREQLDQLAKVKVAEAEKAGKQLLYGDALKIVMAENKDLVGQDSKEQLVGAK